MSSVANVKVAYIRGEGYQDLMEWCEDPNNVYVGRAGIVFVQRGDGNKYRYPKKDSIWANPFKIDKNRSREQAIEEYTEMIGAKLDRGELAKEIMELRGKNLGCWCIDCARTTLIEPRVCHAQVLMEIVGFIERGEWSPL
jgi:hypothetical protein